MVVSALANGVLMYTAVIVIAGVSRYLCALVSQIVLFLLKFFINPDSAANYSAFDFASQQTFVENLAANGPLFLWFSAMRTVIFAPIVEEILFRGFLYKALKCSLYPFAANVVSAVIFAMFHLNLPLFFGLCFVGFCLARVYERSGDIREPIIVHSIFNGIAVIYIMMIDK
jgi:membrane protease YdiL (CAAX protease family)